MAPRFVLAQPAARPAGESLQAWLDRRAGKPGPIELPAAPHSLLIDKPVKIPSGMTLIVRRALIGTPNAALVLSGGGTLHFQDAPVRDVSIHVVDGRATIAGLDYTGTLQQAAVLIKGPGPFHDLLIEDAHVADANYGIAREGGDTLLERGIIRRCRFTRLRGDAIEWNICPKDRGILVEDIDIDTIDDPLGRPAWGIGVGFAGRRYEPDWNSREQVQDFVVRRVRGRRVRQLVHVEAGINFRVEDIQGEQVSDTFAAKSGMPSAFIACYGCRNFWIKDVRSDSGDILLFAGGRDGRYVVPSANFDVRNVALGQGALRTEMGGTDSYARFQNITLSSGTVEFKGQVSRLIVDGLAVRTGAAALHQRPDWLVGTMPRFRPLHPQASYRGVRSN